jgi:hypothetical protein
MLTGNFACLNALTIVQGIATFSDGVLTAAIPIGAPEPASTPVALEIAAIALTLLVLGLSIRPVFNMLSPSQVMNTAFDPLNLVNTYGAFGSITKRRYQLVIQGTRETDPNEDDWETYECKGQPVRTDERPPQWAPYHLRLDWQLWFASMRQQPGPRQRWLFALLEALLENDEEKLSLLETNPFPDEPPEQVRVLRYQYEFTSPEERAETGQWWTRERVGSYVQPVSGADLRRRALFAR